MIFEYMKVLKQWYFALSWKSLLCFSGRGIFHTTSSPHIQWGKPATFWCCDLFWGLSSWCWPSAWRNRNSARIPPEGELYVTFDTFGTESICDCSFSNALSTRRTAFQDLLPRGITRSLFPQEMPPSFCIGIHVPR